MTTPADLTGRLSLDDKVLSSHGPCRVQRAHVIDVPGQTVAVKSARTSESDELTHQSRQHVLKEITALRLMSHENVQTLLGTVVLADETCLVTPYADGGNLRDFLKAHPDAGRRYFLRQIAAGMDYLHSTTAEKDWSIVHGDLHITNVLVYNNATAVISDLGLCEIQHSPDPNPVRDAQAGTSCGTLDNNDMPEGHYASLAPEVAMRKESRSVKSDVYSFGILAFEACTGEGPFAEVRPSSALVRLCSGARPLRPKLGGHFGCLTDDLWDLMVACWGQESSKRPFMSEVHTRLSRNV